MKIGWGRREYSMNVPCNIPGQFHMRVCEGILDPLYITAMAVQGEDTVIFVSIDITSPSTELTSLITEKVRAKHPEIPEDAFVYNATHTHTAMQMFDGRTHTPDGFEVYPPAKTREHASDMGAEAVIEAYESMQDAGVAYGYGYAVVAHSRRVLYSIDMGEANPASGAPNGHAIMYGSTKKPEFEGYEAGADHFVNLLYTFDPNGKLTGIVINVPCPSQTTEMQTKLSADYWAEVRENVAKEFGPDVYVLPQCAAAGDLAPRILHYGRAQQRRMRLKYDLDYQLVSYFKDPESNLKKALGERRDIAERIVSAVKEVYGWAKNDIQKDVVVRHVRKELPVHRRTVSDEEAEWCRKNIEALKASIPDPSTMPEADYRVKVSQINSYINRNERAIERNRTEKPGAMANAISHIIRIGDVAFATNRFELYMDYMHQIQARSPFIQTFIIQLAGEGVGGYLPTERGKQNKGYSASIFCNSVGPEGGRDLVEGTLEALTELADPKE